jgi:hypothetical protein
VCLKYIRAVYLVHRVKNPGMVFGGLLIKA